MTFVGNRRPAIPCFQSNKIMGQREIMILLKRTLFALMLLLGVIANCQKVKEIQWVQDDAQRYMVSKVYQLKYIRANDITPFIEGAIKRYNVNSNVQRLAYAAKNQEILVVSTGKSMIPYVDAMLKILDRPGGKPDKAGSIISGTGISNFAYYPKFRTSEAMARIIRANLIAETGSAYVDLVAAMVYWKSSSSEGAQILRWIDELDRPVPQVQLVLKVYEIRDSDLRELGIDYVAWKNGPGLDLFGAGLNALSINGLESLTDFASGGFDFLFDSVGGFGGIFFAPQFDFSFLKILEQNGKARVATSGGITMVNNPDGSYNVAFAPDFQNIVKTDKDKTTVESTLSSQYALKINGPIICFKGVKNKVEESADGRRYDEEEVSTVDGTIMFNYNLTIESPVEQNNLGAELTEKAVFDSSLTLDVGVERDLASWDKSTIVSQDTGMPFLSSIPGVKYLFGTEDKIKVNSRYIVTVRADWIRPDAELAGWAGKLLTTNKIVEQASVLRPKDYESKAEIDKQDEKTAGEAVKSE